MEDTEKQGEYFQGRSIQLSNDTKNKYSSARGNLLR